MSDALLRSLQRWITDHGYPMTTLCYVSLQAVDPLPLPLTRYLGVPTNIPLFSMDSHLIKNFLSHVGLAKLKLVVDSNTITMHGI